MKLTVAGIDHISVQISRDIYSPLKDLVTLYRLVQVLRKERFDIVHTHTPKASFLGDSLPNWLERLSLLELYMDIISMKTQTHWSDVCLSFWNRLHQDFRI